MAPSDPATLSEALEEIQRLRALGDRLAGALELLTGDMHTPILQRRAARDTERGFVCMLRTQEQLDVVAAPVAEWIVGRGMKLEELQREKASVAGLVARA
jgi:hypothetical protein